jgi:hypothetical protein
LCQAVRSRLNVSRVLRPENRRTAYGGLIGWLLKGKAVSAPLPALVGALHGQVQPELLLEVRVT